MRFREGSQGSLADAFSSCAFAAIPTCCVSFEVAHFHDLVSEACKSIGNYHNPTRKRGIPGNTRETQSLAYAAGCDRHKCATSKCVSEGLCFCVLRMVARNPSLTLRVVINPCVFAVLISPSPEQRNFKTDASGCETSANQRAVRPAQLFRDAAGSCRNTRARKRTSMIARPS